MMVIELILTLEVSPDEGAAIPKLSSPAESRVPGTAEQVKQQEEKRAEKKISRSKTMLNIQIVHE